VELLKVEREIREETLNCFAEELSERLGEELALAKLNLNSLDTDMNKEEAEKVEISKFLISKAIHDLRNLTRDILINRALPMKLMDAIRCELDMLTRSKPCHIHLDVKKEPPKLNKAEELILFRLVQESLHGLITHTGVKNILVSVNSTAEYLELHILDDGNGPGADGFENNEECRTGINMKQMRRRAGMINADFIFDCRLNAGTLIRMTLPLGNGNSEPQHFIP